jgi:hypothetical protein
VLRAQFDRPGNRAGAGFAACEVEIDLEKFLTAKSAKYAKKTFVIFFANFAAFLGALCGEVASTT